MFEKRRKIITLTDSIVKQPHKTFGPMTDEVTWGWRNLHNEKLQSRSPRQILLGLSNQRAREGQGKKHTWKREPRIKF